jgi:integrase
LKRCATPLETHAERQIGLLNLIRFPIAEVVRCGADVNFTRIELHLKGDPETATKNGETRFVPMIPELERMLRELRAERTDEPRNATVMRVSECEQHDHAAEKIGMKRITHHDLRHLFATISIESGVDIPTVSRWLGWRSALNEDLRHVRQEHSFAQARRVSFGTAVGV